MADVRRAGKSSLPAPLRAFLVSALGCTFLALLASALRADIQGTHFGADGLWFPDVGFDFWVYYPRYLHRHSIQFFFFPAYPWYYPASAIFCFYPFFALAHRIGSIEVAYRVFGVCAVLGAVTLCIALARALRRAGLAAGPTSAFCTLASLTVWPLYFAIQRGNIEAFTWMLLAVAMWALIHQRPGWAAWLIGAVGSVKLYPLIFGALFLRPGWRKWLPLLAVSAVVTTVLSLHLMDPSVREAWFWVRQGVQHFTVIYAEVYHDAEWDHSLFGLFKDLTHTHIQAYHRELVRYYGVAGIPVGLLFVLRARTLPLLNQVLFLTCAAVCLPPTSFDYTLALVYVPLGLLAVASVAAEAQGMRLPNAGLIMVLLGIVLAPTTFLYSQRAPFLPGAVKAICLLTLVLLASMRPLLPCIFAPRES